ncbi:MAG: DUF1508 domain-containing protein [Gemmataceae bacterium]
MIRRSFFAAVFALPLMASMALAADAKLSFEVYADAKDEYRWRLKDGDTILATSGQGYSKKVDCTKMISNFKADITKYEVVIEEDNRKEYRFSLMAKNGNKVGASTKGYKSKADAEKVIDTIKKRVKNADVTEIPKEKK